MENIHNSIIKIKSRLKLLKVQEAKDKEQERIKRKKFELVMKMKEEQLKEEVYYSKELKKDMRVFLREQERETRKQKAKQQQEIINNLKGNYKSVLQVPKLVKISLNQGIGKNSAEKKFIENDVDSMLKWGLGVEIMAL